MRRNVGPVAWCALEAIASQATLSGEINRAAASVRSVAADLAIAPNTAHRALRRLIDLGLVEARQSRTSGGRFAGGSIRLTIPSRVLRIETECENVPVPQVQTAKSVRRPESVQAAEQLVLLPPE